MIKNFKQSVLLHFQLFLQIVECLSAQDKV